MVALLFTDLVGSTELLEHLGDDAAEDLRRIHFSLLRKAVADTGGHEVKSLGDGLMVSFPSVLGAVGCAVAMQRAVAAHSCVQPERALRIRVGVDVGEPVADEGDFFGTTVVVAKRLCDKAEGGQILASEIVAALLGNRGGFRFRPAGRLKLKGLAQPLPAVTVDWDEAGRPGSAHRRPSSRRAPLRGPRLVGRDGEMATLDAALERAAAGELSCVLVVGDPGVGKTRLAAELLARESVTSLSARAYPLGETAAFGLWAEALERHLRPLPASEVSALCGGFLDDLAGLLRSAAAARGSVPDREPSRHRLIEGLTVVLANLAQQADGEPLVVSLDDVHWADASSWEVLQYLARTLPDARLLVLAAARPGELAEHPVASKVLLALDRDGLLTRLTLSPLGSAAVGELAEAVLGDAVPGALVAWLDERSRGNPLFTLGLLRALQEERADLTHPRLRRLPEALADQVAQRLDGLDEPARSTLEVLAALGRRVELGEIVGLSGRPLDRLAPILDGLVRARLIVDEERGAELTYEVAHPLVAEAIYQGIGTARRRALHRLVARALLAAGRLGEAAPHFARSADVGDPEAVEALTDALRQAEGRGAYREALGVLGSLVDLLPAGDERWLEVAGAMSWEAEWVIDHRADVYAALAIQALRAIDAALGPDSDPALRAGVRFRLATFLGWGTGDVEEAQSVGREAMALFEAVGDRQRMLVAELEYAFLFTLGGDSEAAPAAGWRVVAKAAPAGDEFVLMQAFGRSIGYGALMLGRLEESEDALHKAAALAGAAGRAYFHTMVEMFLSWSSAFRGHLNDAYGYVEKGKSDPEWRETVLLEAQCMVQWMAGDLGAALAAAEESLTWNAGRLGRRRAWGLAYAAVSAVEAERVDDARRYLAPALAAYGGRPWMGCLGVCHWAQAVIIGQQRGSAAALDDLRRAASSVLDVKWLTMAAPILVDLAEAAAACERADVAREAAGRLEEIAGLVDSDLYQAFAALGAAWAELGAGAAKRAIGPAARAVELLAGTGCRLFHGRALDVIGRALSDSDRPRAVEALEQAAALFETCGATWRRDRVVEFLGQLGTRGKRAAGAVTGPDSLTARERQAARLAAQGLTVRQIGERLFIGERTVESHLARAYAKLGVTSKSELVVRASELGL
jgi:class 3 adenylate cyclase/DNA-binding CsgD family transcriptional regulator